MPDETAVPPRGRATSSLWPRRIGALFVDWAVASAISAGFFDYAALATLGIFAVMRVLLTATLGSSIGQRLLGLGVRRAGDAVPSVGQALVRTAALCLVVPAGITTQDGRGMHDVWAGTRLERLR